MRGRGIPVCPQLSLAGDVACLLKGASAPMAAKCWRPAYPAINLFNDALAPRFDFIRHGVSMGRTVRPFLQLLSSTLRPPHDLAPRLAVS